MTNLIVKTLIEDRTGTYVAAVLTEASRRKLLAQVFPVHENVIAHHMTISYNPEQETYAQKYDHTIGSRVSLTVRGRASDDQVQAVLVEGWPSENEFPHVTISTVPGVSARLSNDLLAKGFTPIKPFKLSAVIQNIPLDSPV
jgi:hypothetical protein